MFPAPHPGARRRPLPAVAVLAVAFALAVPAAQAAEVLSWETATTKAEGQTVYWNAWGGDERINAYIDWVGEEMDARHDITLRHVKLSDTAEAVSRVLAEKAAGRDSGGAIDLIWINGENFAKMKESDLLYGPFTAELPNFDLVDFEDKPTTLVDFTVPTDGLEAPWGMAKLNLIYDSARIQDTPDSIRELLDWAEANPGRFTYPAPPDFLGSTFLKQALIGLTDHKAALQAPVQSKAQFAEVTAPLWAYLEALHPHLWRQGRAFPRSGPEQHRMLNDRVVDIALSFYPSEASSLIAAGRLPESARTFVFADGMIGNTHFVAIPYNAAHKAGAMVVANFLMSPEAQAKKQNPEVWGDQTVLALEKLSPEQRKLFEELPRGEATLPPDELGPTLLEPHPSWMTRIETEWRTRFAG